MEKKTKTLFVCSELELMYSPPLPDSRAVSHCCDSTGPFSSVVKLLICCGVEQFVTCGF